MIAVQGRFRNTVLRVADRLLHAILPPARAPVRPKAPRVLIIRCDHLGDATLSTAPLQTIRDALKPSRMDVACGPWAAAVFEGHPAVDQVLTVAAPWWRAKDRDGVAAKVRAWLALAAFARRIRMSRYDIGIDLRGDIRHFIWFFGLGGIPERISSDRTGGAVFLTSCVHHDENLHEVARTLAIAAAVGAAPVGRPTLAARVLTPEVRTTLGIPSRFIAIAPSGTSPNRVWPSELVAAFVKLAFRELGVPVIYLGSDADRSHALQVGLGPEQGFISLAGQTSVEQLIAVLAEAELVVAMDSGPMHIAAALRRPIVALWGPTPAAFLPYSDEATIVRPPEGCPCTGRTCQFTLGAGRCFRSIAGAVVFAAVRECLAGIEAASHSEA
jgi:ADP-heptose:LPS heptosyltransferase